MDLLDGEARRVSEVAVSSNAALVSPSWSPDGKRLAFASIVEPTVQGKQKNQGPQDIWVIDSDGANRHRLTDGSGLCLTPCWSFDHRVYFISDRGGHENIWSVRAQERPNWPVASDPKRSGDRTAVGAGDASEVQK